MMMMKMTMTTTMTMAMTMTMTMTMTTMKTMTMTMTMMMTMTMTLPALCRDAAARSTKQGWEAGALGLTSSGVQGCTALLYFPNFTALHLAVFHCTALHCTVLYCSALHYGCTWEAPCTLLSIPLQGCRCTCREEPALQREVQPSVQVVMVLGGQLARSSRWSGGHVVRWSGQVVGWLGGPVNYFTGKSW